MWKKLEMLNLSQHKLEETISCQNQIIILPILELNKILMCEFLYDYVEPNYSKKVKLCYMDTDSLTAYIKTNYIYKGIVEDVEIRFYISNYESGWLLPKEKSKK